MSSTRTLSQLCPATPTSSLIRCYISFRICLRQSPRLFESKVYWGNHICKEKWTDTYSIHHWRIIWISHRKLVWRSNRPSYQVMSSPRTQSQLCTATSISTFVQCRFRFGYCLRQSPRLFWSKFYWGNDMSVAEWTDIYGIHNWRIIWSSYRKLVWVGFEPTTTEFR